MQANFSEVMASNVIFTYALGQFQCIMELNKVEVYADVRKVIFWHSDMRAPVNTPPFYCPSGKRDFDSCLFIIGSTSEI